MSEPTADHVRMPSKAFNDAKGAYHPDKDNQPLAFANMGAHDLGQLEHGVRPGYCGQHGVLGCDSPDCK
jgi:hypothetical protein